MTSTNKRDDGEVELLPLPEGLKGTLVDFRDEGYPLNRTLECIEDYARANVERALAESRADAQELRETVGFMGSEIGMLKFRIQRLRAALREVRGFLISSDPHAIGRAFKAIDAALEQEPQE